MSSAGKVVGSGQTQCSSAVLQAIYGTQDSSSKEAAYTHSLGNWWREYSHRKNDEDEEHVRNWLSRSDLRVQSEIGQLTFHLNHAARCTDSNMWLHE